MAHTTKAAGDVSPQPVISRLQMGDGPWMAARNASATAAHDLDPTGDLGCDPCQGKATGTSSTSSNAPSPSADGGMSNTN